MNGRHDTDINPSPASLLFSSDHIYIFFFFSTKKNNKALYGFTPTYFVTNGLIEYVKYFATPMATKMTTTMKRQDDDGGVGRRRVVPMKLLNLQSSSGTTITKTKTSQHLLYQLIYLILYVLILGTYQSYLYHYPQYDILWKYHNDYEILPWLSLRRMFNVSQWIACFFQASKLRTSTFVFCIR